ncbi:Ref family recombination enhancement nuclease [Variovorax sp. NFACC27]|uniref:Ref family recombination enhancement nuclease n=1 Tax=unclassified Variovorax TaxID=663243 RepID=UPI000896CF2F|nr:Recombination enhancement, RecA-dependent nuclease [Variovorax sp. NFACC28]SEG89630.1 Recombination enhancement, RecA-dependent nuclease [Variovorax sp. NFACC29]SFD40400.1 Recombination enhancement, RecA-dependent nuclease [Variovorax sp. NFACC26]SFG42652.1 Recombination enhancement, RecA-dependent nuclease [Variovorax sp. NFACC27]
MTFARKPYIRKQSSVMAMAERAGLGLKPNGARNAVLAFCGGSNQPAPKTTRAAIGVLEHLHKSRLVELGCMCCQMALGVFTPGVELHHRRAGMGWGKGDWLTLIPLCPEHHRGATGVHGLGTKGFPKHYGFTEQDMLDKALQLLNINAMPTGQKEDHDKQDL